MSEKEKEIVVGEPMTGKEFARMIQNSDSVEESLKEYEVIMGERE